MSDDETANVPRVPLGVCLTGMGPKDAGARGAELCDGCGINVDSDRKHAGFCAYPTAGLRAG
ncbi:hypothetical protein [Streptomyces sp. NPDC096033]|uniref:hypothetical protein n=1 Tax=Streptomyces sp. NPDC096033 TaxID=3366071 RepID=UPI0037F22AD2